MNSSDGDIHADCSSNMTLATINLRSVAQNETIVPSNDNSGPARLSEALQLADSGLSLGDRFFDTVFRAAHQAGCELLFEIPTVLFREESSRAAAVRSAGDDEGEFFYVLFSESEGAVSIVDAAEVGESVVDFTRSYAGVLNLIGSDREIITPLLQ